MERNQNRFGRRGFTGTSPSSTSVANYGNSAMSRGTFMRGLGLAGAGVAAGVMGLSGVARATGGSTTVVGQNNPAVDPGNVQAAVSNFDTIYLQGTFNFGDQYQPVSITKDVEIIGLQGATITGGCESIYCNEKVKLAVRNINFNGASFAAIYIIKSSGAEITGCTITNVITEYGCSFPIALTTWETYPPPSNQNDITGNILIQGNTLDPGVDNSAWQDGIMLWGINATATITGNTVRNFSARGIFCDNNLGFTTISNNKVYMVPEGGGYGIKVGEGTCAVAHGIYQGSAIVTGNEIHSTCPWADGICLDGGHQLENAVFSVSHNYVNMTNSPYGALDCYGVLNSIWESNTVEGDVGYAIWLSELDVWGIGEYIYPAQNNVFKGNNVAAVRDATAWATVVIYCGANNNTLVGNFNKSLINMGDYCDYCRTGACPSGNYITGYTKKPLGPLVGQAIKDAMARKHELMKSKTSQ